jgi:hypothetical protein
MSKSEEQPEPLVNRTVQAPVDQPGWLLGIVDHIVTINHELGEVVQEQHWQRKVLKIVLVILILLALLHGSEMVELLSRTLDLVT